MHLTGEYDNVNKRFRLSEYSKCLHVLYSAYNCLAELSQIRGIYTCYSTYVYGGIFRTYICLIFENKIPCERIKIS